MRAAIWVALALVAFLPAAGCGGTSSDAVPIEIFTPYRGVEADRFREVLEPFVRRTGIPVRVVGSEDFVSDLEERTGESNDPPDVAVVPQPGLVEQLVREQKIVPTSRAVDRATAANLEANSEPLGVVDGDRYGIPFRITLKSLVWYRPEVFAANGWQVPRTLAELDRLAARIAAESEMAPWCLGLEAGTATGWAATDWAEDLVLRTAGPTAYREWATGARTFAYPEIAAAFTRLQDLVLARGRLAGGLSSLTRTPVDETLDGLLTDPPACAMAKQADFAANWLPDGTSIGPKGDVNVFPLPGSRPGQPPVVFGGGQIVQFRRSADIDALMEYLAGPDAGISWVRRGGFLSPKSSIPPDAYPEGYLAALATLAGDTPVLAIDASDRMPPSIGSGLVWREITEWATGVIDYETFARRVDRARAQEPED